jgi:hypothetical protein
LSFLRGSDHHRKRLLFSALAPSKFGYGVFLGGIANQVIATQSLQCHDPTAAQQIRHVGKRIILDRMTPRSLT